MLHSSKYSNLTKRWLGCICNAFRDFIALFNIARQKNQSAVWTSFFCPLSFSAMVMSSVDVAQALQVQLRWRSPYRPFYRVMMHPKTKECVNAPQNHDGRATSGDGCKRREVTLPCLHAQKLPEHSMREIGWEIGEFYVLRLKMAKLQKHKREEERKDYLIIRSTIA